MNSVTILYSGCAMEAPSQITTIPPARLARRNISDRASTSLQSITMKSTSSVQTFLELVNLCVQIEIGIIIYKLISIFFAFGLGAVPQLMNHGAPRELLINATVISSLAKSIWSSAL